MAWGVDRGWTREWSPIAQGLYVFLMMWGTMYAVIGGSGAWGALTKGVDTTPSVMSNGYFWLMTLVILAFAVARVLEAERGWSFTRSGTAIVGVVAIFLGVRPPSWFLRNHRLAWLGRVIGVAGVRLSYAAIGIACLVAALTGWPAFMLLK
jgi:hypothetical protein